MNAIKERSFETDNHFLRLMDSLPLMVCKLNTNRKGVYFNKEWLSFTGRPLEDLLGDGWLNAIHSKDRSRCAEAFETATELQEALKVEHRMHRHDGHHRHVLNTVVPQYSDRGLFAGYISAVLDIDHQTAAAGASGSNVMRHLAEDALSPGNIAWVDCAGRIAQVNEAWLRFARRNKARRSAAAAGALYLDACRAAMALSGGDASASWDGILSVLDGSLSEFRTEYRCPVGREERWFEMIVQPVRRPEGGAVITHLDITRCRDAELQRDSLLEELTCSDRPSLAGELMRSLVLQLNEPLNSMLSNARSLKRLIPLKPLAIGVIEDPLSQIITDDLRAGRIVRQLRLLLKRDPGQVALLNVNRMVRVVAALLRNEAQAVNIEISISPDPALLPIRGKRFHLQLVFLNLVLNSFEAIRHADAASRHLTIQTCMVGKSQVAIAVGYSGPKIPAHQLGRSFEPLAATDTEPPRSGLALCRSIVKEHHGEISVAGNGETGSIFRVVLPASQRPER
jgi:PAS domain S-box-containing protein